MSAKTNEHETRQSSLRRIPRVDHVVASDRLTDARRRLGEQALTRLARKAIAEVRQRVLDGGEPSDIEQVAEQVQLLVDAVMARRAQRVINATGVVLHTNLGRAPLPQSAVEALSASAGGYTSIELDLGTGRRGPRGGFAETALAELSGAEDALVVNNNAAAVLLVLTALARGRGVLVSRGELVQIGGGFRVPDVVARSGARMIEVGTTNRTGLADYERLFADPEADVQAVLRVHQGNFRQVGFVERPALSKLAKLTKEHGALLIKDLGGGAMLDMTSVGLPGEPTVRACVDAGADLVCFSCDKVLGGPQGGAIVGRAELVNQVRRDPLARALRLGRLPLVALEAVLAQYLEGALDENPTLFALRRPLSEVTERVEEWCRQLSAAGLKVCSAEVPAAVGAGALAEAPVPSVAAVLECDDVEGVAARLRQHAPPVMARIHEGRLLLDGRSVLPGEDETLLQAVLTAAM